MTVAREPETEVMELRLYIAGGSPNSLRAVANLKAICDEGLVGLHVLEVVDVLEQPLRPVTDRILVTPTLLKLKPPPEQRIVGDLNDRAGVLLSLGMEPSL